jgi:hypothetical protein
MGFGAMVPLLIQTGQLQPIIGRSDTDRLFGVFDTVVVAGQRGHPLDPVRWWCDYVAQVPAPPEAAAFGYTAPTNIWATLLALYRAEAWITPTSTLL